MGLSKCKDCATVFQARSGKPGLCPECRRRPAAAKYTLANMPANPDLQCATCGAAFRPKNQRQRFCEKLACKPIYKPKGIPRSLAPLSHARAVNAVAGYLMAEGYTEVWQSITGVGKCALVFRGTVPGLAVEAPLMVEVRTVVELTNGEVRFPKDKSPVSDYRAYVAIHPERESVIVTFDPALPATHEPPE